MKKVIFLILIFCSCVSYEDNDNLFKKTINVVARVIDTRFNIPPSPEDFENGVDFSILNKRPDSLIKLKLYIGVGSLDIDFKKYKEKFTKDYMFIFENKSLIVNYSPRNITSYETEDYRITFLKNKKIQSFIGTDKLKQSDVGGVLQFSKVFINYEKNKAIIFKRWSKSKANSTEEIIFLKKINNEWVINKLIPISVS